MYTITLADGTKLSNLTLNGNNFVSKTLIDDKTFQDNLSLVIIDREKETDGDFAPGTYQDMELVQNTSYDGIESYFILTETPRPDLEGFIRGIMEEYTHD